MPRCHAPCLAMLSQPRRRRYETQANAACLDQRQLPGRAGPSLLCRSWTGRTLRLPRCSSNVRADVERATLPAAPPHSAPRLAMQLARRQAEPDACGKPCGSWVRAAPDPHQPFCRMIVPIWFAPRAVRQLRLLAPAAAPTQIVRRPSPRRRQSVNPSRSPCQLPAASN